MNRTSQKSRWVEWKLCICWLVLTLVINVKGRERDLLKRRKKNSKKRKRKYQFVVLLSHKETCPVSVYWKLIILCFFILIFRFLKNLFVHQSLVSHTNDMVCKYTWLHYCKGLRRGIMIKWCKVHLSMTDGKWKFRKNIESVCIEGERLKVTKILAASMDLQF